ncbi:MAG: DNA cytosine methyltransferase [Chloroflexi bacterium]|nr:DNA cytosine methyltransferase [Chloroflexota bacterium]
MQSTQLKLFDSIQTEIVSQPTSKLISDTLDFEYESGWPDDFGKKLLQWAQTNLERPINTLSLFSGGGGLDIGFHDAGFTILEMVEVDSRFAKTLDSNSGNGKYLGESKVTCMDIREFVPPDDLKIDFIIGGPPCQTFSAAGRRAAGVQGTNDDRGRLFWEYVRLLEQLEPAGFLFENVYGITGAQNGQAWREIQQAFADAGYKIFHRVLDAADFGVPQHRERLFIVGVKNGSYLFPKPTHGPDSLGRTPHYSAGHAIASIVPQNGSPQEGLGGRYGHLLDEVPPGLNYSFFTAKMGHPNPIFAWRSKFSDFLYKADPNRPIRTVKAQGGQYTGPFHWRNRKFTINELKRLQTFPDSYELIGGNQVAIHQIGNSVPPQLTRILALSILEQIFGQKLPFTLPKLEITDQLTFRKRKRQLTKYYRDRASEAIEKLPKQPIITLPRIRNFQCTLSSKFQFSELDKPHTSSEGFKVCSDLTADKWTITVSQTAERNDQPFVITITPKPSFAWNIPARQIVLKIETHSPKVFTVAWKALEHELKTLKLKADLVQLCGYYQYSPSFSCKMQISEANADDNWILLANVVEGAGTRKLHSVRDLANAWSILPQETADCVHFLKQLGYEVRNESTNPQIPCGHYLVPYSFPTLNHQSVQLRKEL